MTKGKILLLFFSLILSFIQFHCCTMIALQLSSKKSLSGKSSPEKWEELKTGKEIHISFPKGKIITGKFIQLKNDTISTLMTFNVQDSQKIFSSVPFLSQTGNTDKVFSKEILISRENTPFYTGFILKPDECQSTYANQDTRLFIPIKRITRVQYHSLKWGWISLGIVADAVLVYSAILQLEKIKIGQIHWPWEFHMSAIGGDWDW